MPSVKFETLSVKFKKPCVKFETLSVKFNMPSVKFKKSSVMFETLSVKFEKLSVMFENPSVTFWIDTLPLCQNTFAENDINTQAEVAGATYNFKL